MKVATHIGIEVAVHTLALETASLKYACPAPAVFAANNIDQAKEMINAMIEEKFTVPIIVMDDSVTMKHRLSEVRKMIAAHVLSPQHTTICKGEIESFSKMEDPYIFELIPRPTLNDYKVKSQPWHPIDHNRTKVKNRAKQTKKKRKK